MEISIFDPFSFFKIVSPSSGADTVIKKQVKENEANQPKPPSKKIVQSPKKTPEKLSEKLSEELAEKPIFSTVFRDNNGRITLTDDDQCKSIFGDPLTDSATRCGFKKKQGSNWCKTCHATYYTGFTPPVREKPATSFNYSRTKYNF